MSSKYILLIAGIFVIAVFIISLIVLSSSQGQVPPAYSPTISPSPAIEKFPELRSVTQPVQVTTTPEHLTPEEVARKFYSWYLTYPGVSALSGGAYKTNIYLSDKFKQFISGMAPYDAQNDQVFCTPNKLSNFTVLPATTALDGRQSVIIQSFPEGKNLYKIKLVNVNNRWLVDDTICIP